MKMNLTKWSKRNVTVSAFLIIMAIAIYNWFVTPHAHYLMAAQKYQQTIDSLNNKNKILNNDIRIRRKKLDNLKKEFEQEKQSFFDIEQAKTFLSNLQITAQQNGCLVENIRFMPANNVTDRKRENTIIHQYQSDLTLSGDYGSIVKFINVIQNRPEKVWVESINFGTKNTANGDLGCDLKLSIYTLKVMERIENVSNKK
ncbi:MAG: hypothetical protein BWY69_01447 [Planctomycetes bacterium ADurb.Bin401]|nr:MAG: hypothetical protein BWY69_01447 [Planctomycetes bacterium ADurb.Bin401]